MPETFDPRPVCRHLTAASDHLRAAANEAGTAVDVARVEAILVSAKRVEHLRTYVEGDARRPAPKPRFP